VAFAETIKGQQDAGVIAVAKHFILNEQGRKSNASHISSAN
jgi:beta-glucosidase-like glycosyl hydrolase